MGQRHCWSCGGEMGSYASTCPWCGRSVARVQLLQFGSLAVLVLGGLIVSGIIPWSTVRGFVDLGPPPVMTDAMVAPGDDGSVRSGGGGGSRTGLAPATTPQGGSRASGRNRRETSTAERRDQPARPLAGAAPRCDAPERLASLARRHAEWSASDLAAIACGRVQVGFTDEQVRTARGRPLRTEQDPSTPSRETWHYADATVTLEAGRVVASNP